jgi:hypothetical protein
MPKKKRSALRASGTGTTRKAAKKKSGFSVKRGARAARKAVVDVTKYIGSGGPVAQVAKKAARSAARAERATRPRKMKRSTAGKSVSAAEWRAGFEKPVRRRSKGEVYGIVGTAGAAKGAARVAKKPRKKPVKKRPTKRYRPKGI